MMSYCVRYLHGALQRFSWGDLRLSLAEVIHKAAKTTGIPKKLNKHSEYSSSAIFEKLSPA